MRASESGTVVEMSRTPSSWRRVAFLLFGAVGLGGCGIGKLDRGDNKSAISTKSAQSQAVSDAYKKKMGTIAALPKGGPGKGAAPPPRTAPNAAKGSLEGGAQDTTVKRGFKATVAGFLRNRTGVRRAAAEPQAPIKLRGRYAKTDSGDVFVLCNDTTRYAVQATIEARYLMDERLRFIVRGLKTPVYAVFTGTIVAQKPTTPAGTAQTPSGAQKAEAPTAGQKAPPRAATPQRKSIFVNKVDTLTTNIPPGCRQAGISRAAS